MTDPAPPPFLVHARYEPRALLGRGAQGVVGRVVDREAPGRELVAKVYQSKCFREDALLGEFALLARLRIAGVVRAHDLGRDERTGAPFIVEEFVAGEDAATWVRQAASSASRITENTARTERLVTVLGGVAAALSGLHDAGFVHSDLKPAHVRMTHPAAAPDRLPAPILLDLGAAVARARSPEGPQAFTRGYAAPEVMAGAAACPRSDLYGLGALAWAIVTGAPPEPSVARRPLRERARWVRPSVAELIEALIEPHPRDRPSEAREILYRLGMAKSEAGVCLSEPPAPIGRETELSALLAPSASTVRYVVGPSGIGKSHLARELVTRALLSGRSARIIAFPQQADPRIPRLVDFFRGSDRAWPFATLQGERTALLLVLDALDCAPAELVSALDAYRCRPASTRRVDVVATARSAPEGADSMALEPLAAESFAGLCRSLGVEGEERIQQAAVASGSNPGWLVASLGRVPLTRDTILERIRSLSPAASELFAAIALSGGALPEAVCARFCTGRATDLPLSELLAASLAARRQEPAGTLYTLAAPGLAKDIASAFADLKISDRLAEAWLAQPNAPASALLCVAGAPSPPGRRSALLQQAAAQARQDGLRSEEIDALLALAAEPDRRTPDLLCRLERLARDAGLGATYPQVLAWLGDAGRGNPRLLPLALRRRAEKHARDGDLPAAQALAQEALEAARRIQDPAAEAFARATIGYVALFRADWESAEQSLAQARAEWTAVAADDPEEVARLYHNTGVVALYRGKIGEAIDTFERSLAEKRALGDRAGMRSCLMNLGMALGKASRFDEACAALDEAMKLARSLGQQAGLGWCLFARAEIEVRRHNARAADRFIAEAEALDASLPAAIRADLAILRAHVKLLDGDGEGALAELSQVDSAARAGDRLIDGRATIAEASAHLAKLPAQPRRAARLAIGAIRAARKAMLPEVEAQALEVLRSARAHRAAPLPAPASAEKASGEPLRPDRHAEAAEVIAAAGKEQEALWAWIASAAATDAPAEMALSLARLIVQQSGAERGFIASVDSGGHLVQAWGADLDGLEMSQAHRRLDAALVRTVLGGDAPLYQRDVPTAGGRGSRLAVAGPDPPQGLGRAVVVIEHRFRPGAFDSVTAQQPPRWAALAALALRLGAAGLPQAASSPDRADIASDDDAPEPVAQGLDALAFGARGAGRAPLPAEPTTVLPVSEPRRRFPDILGESPALKRALARLDAAIDSELPVLITGETGTGKELFARALHELGPRARREFVAINCGAVPDALFEAELFGHARGSFTGAERARPGLIARAEGGTLLLDELGELPLARQAALLRTLESRRYRPVGSDEERPFDVRVVAATNRDLLQAVAEKTFRQDLLFRVNAIDIHVPPLRDRAGDIATLARAFLERAGSQAEIAPRAMAALLAYEWPGNVRELEHQMQRLAALGVRRIDAGHLPRPMRARAGLSSPTEPPVKSNEAPPEPAGERDAIRRVLAETGGNISHAAARLGITRQGLKKRMVRLGMRAPAGAQKQNL